MFSGKDNSSAFHGELRHMKIYDETIDINEINKNLYEPFFMNHWKLTDNSGQDSIANTTNASLNHVVVTESECIFDGSGDYIDLGENISFKHDFEQDMLNVPEKTKKFSSSNPKSQSSFTVTVGIKLPSKKGLIFFS